jgi:signal transduction histidine kinase
MVRAPLGRLLALFAGAALTALFIVRVGVFTWACTRVPDNTRAGLMLPWLVDTALTATILIAVFVGCWWLTCRARCRERAEAHAEHLAEIGLLAGGLAHEIGNTLNAMHSQIALLRKELPPEAGTACQRTGKLERAVTELEELVEEFLTFARPAKDQLGEVDLAELIAGLLDFVALDLEQSRVTARSELGPDLMPVYVDAGKFKRALLNLLINARQAMPEGGTLTVRARQEPGQIVIEVHDTGRGIAEEERPRVFQSFFSTKPDGTGLGLAVVKRTVEDCGGLVTFDSEVGRGTTFRIFLPTAERRRMTLGRQATTPRRVGAPV